MACPDGKGKGEHAQLALLVVRAPVAKLAHALAPSFIAAGLQRIAHQGFHLLFAHTVFTLDVGKADMIGQRHLDDLADMLGRQGFGCIHGGPNSGVPDQGKRRALFALQGQPCHFVERLQKLRSVGLGKGTSTALMEGVGGADILH